MGKKALLVGLAVLALLGIGDSFYLAESAMTDTALICDIDGLNGCNTVAQSPYANLYGIPLGVYGIAFYTLALLLVLLIAVSPRKLLFQALLVVSSVGVLASLIFLGIQVFLIQATCIYCIASAVITFVMLPLSYRLLRRFAPELPVVVP